jgi:hypothetical protein
MKKYFTSIFIWISLTAYSQIYQPFPIGASRWTEHTQDPTGYPTQVTSSNYYVYNVGDTLIAGHLYQLLQGSGFTRVDINPGGFGGPPSSFLQPFIWNNGNTIAYRDTLKKIYFYNFLSNVDSVAYDFNLNLGDTLGDTFLNMRSNSNYVSGIDSFLVGADYHKRFWISQAGNPQPFVALIEGVGSTNGLIEKLTPPFEIFATTICFNYNGYQTMIDTISGNFDCDIYASVSDIENINANVIVTPNPVNNLFTVKLKDPSTEKIEIISSLGVKMFSQEINNSDAIVIDSQKWKSGIYFLKVTCNKSKDSKIIIRN